jgi:hypothetical protein
MKPLALTGSVSCKFKQRLPRLMLALVPDRVSDLNCELESGLAIQHLAALVMIGGGSGRYYEKSKHENHAGQWKRIS